MLAYTYLADIFLFFIIRSESSEKHPDSASGGNCELICAQFCRFVVYILRIVSDRGGIINSFTSANREFPWKRDLCQIEAFAHRY